MVDGRVTADSLDRCDTWLGSGNPGSADVSLRPSFEDWIGAGAIIACLGGTLSPEARAALAAFREAESELESLVRQCGSGKELIQRGREQDVTLAAGLDVSDCAPLFVDGAYVRAG